MEKYSLYHFNLPKLTEDGKGVLPAEPSRVDTFEQLEQAQAAAKSNASKFDRVVLTRVSDEGESLVERYTDGKPVEPGKQFD